ncbi:MAG: cold shock domain-containing protein [Acidovorax sp.]
MRYEGRLKKWNAERGFGFIVADDGGAELFVHISAFARDGRMPVVGETLSFEVEPGRDGKKCAVRVRRPGEPAASTAAPRRDARRNATQRDHGPGFLGWLVGVLFVCALAWLAYGQYAKRAARYGSALPAPPVSVSSAKLPVPPDFKCDGRNLCSQMTSCREATLFLQNCPGMKLDGNGDGVPCEQQWCSK